MLRPGLLGLLGKVVGVEVVRVWVVLRVAVQGVHRDVQQRAPVQHGRSPRQLVAGGCHDPGYGGQCGVEAQRLCGSSGLQSVRQIHLLPFTPFLGLFRRFEGPVDLKRKQKIPWQNKSYDNMPN